VIVSGESAGLELSGHALRVVVAASRVPQFEQVAAPSGFSVPQIGHRISVDGASCPPQLRQNLLFGLLDVPHCGQ
jgi:hypothetical protein